MSITHFADDDTLALIESLKQQLAEVKDALSDYYFPGLPLAYSVAELAKEYKQRNEAAGTYLDQITEIEQQLAEREKQIGIIVRDYFAAKAMQGMFANPEIGESLNAIATAAYRAADAMMEARK